MKEEYVLDEVNSDTLLTTREETKTVMTKLMTEMALVASINDVGFRNLAKKNNLRAGKYLSGLVHLISADPPHNV